jgi:hypothetical protein
MFYPNVYKNYILVKLYLFSKANIHNYTNFSMRHTQTRGHSPNGPSGNNISPVSTPHGRGGRLGDFVVIFMTRGGRTTSVAPRGPSFHENIITGCADRLWWCVGTGRGSLVIRSRRVMKEFFETKFKSLSNRRQHVLSETSTAFENVTCACIRRVFRHVSYEVERFSVAAYRSQ